MKRLSFFCLTCALLFCLSACSVHNVSRGQAEGEAYDAVISVKGKDEAAKSGKEAEQDTADADTTAGEEKALPVNAEDEAAMEGLSQQLKALTELVGKEDDAASGLLGGGVENRTEDGTVLVGRNYRTELFGQESSVYTSYDEAGLVSMVVAELSGQAQEYEKLLTALYGEAAFLEEEEEQSWCWENSGYRFTLYEFEDGVCLDVGWAL